jgi:hypothetical protein
MKFDIKEIDVNPKCVDGEVTFVETAGCECCDELEPYSAMISDGNTYWCLDCWEADKDDIPKKVLKEILQKVKEAKIKYHQDKIKELNK